MKALIISTRFNPGHYSHLTANYHLLAELGFEPVLLVNEQFNKMNEDGSLTIVNSIKDVAIREVSVAIFWFPSVMNLYYALKLKWFRKTKIVFIFHEPFESFVNYLKSGFGLIKVIKIWLIGLINNVMLLLSSNIILPSTKAYNIYKHKYARLNTHFTAMPLLFEDEFNATVLIADKIYIAYIGTVAKDHAFDNFVNFIEYASENQLYPGHRFLIATGSTIPQVQIDQLSKYVTVGKIKIQHGRPLLNGEINHYFEKSAIVWNAYNRSMQSGVLAKSFMFGTPVIGLDSNSNEFIEDHSNSILIKNNSDYNEINSAILQVLENQQRYSINAREKFLKTFFYKNQLIAFKQILQN